jgi:hypothetical protein
MLFITKSKEKIPTRGVSLNASGIARAIKAAPFSSQVLVTL